MRPVPEDESHHFRGLVLVAAFKLPVADNDGTEFLACVDNIFFIVDLLAQESFHLVGDAFAELVIFVDVAVVIGEGLVAFDQSFIALLQLQDVVGHLLVVLYHRSELQHLTGHFFAGDFQFFLQLDDLVGWIYVVSFCFDLLPHLLLAFHHKFSHFLHVQIGDFSLLLVGSDLLHLVRK